MTMLSFWHVLYLLMIAAGTGVTIAMLRGKSVMAKEKTLNRISLLILLTYLADFCWMSFVRGEIGAEKLPFHICTLSAILIYLTRHHKPFFRFREPVMLVGLVCALFYLVAPGNVLWMSGPVSYSVIQNFLYHGLLAAYGIVALATGSVRVSVRNLHHVTALMTGVMAWEFLGNKLFAVERHFVRASRLAMMAREQNELLTPVAMIFLFTAAAGLICGICMLAPRLHRAKEEKAAIIYIADRRAV